MERESFDVVWAMSEPGSGVAEGCLLRCTDYAHLPEEERHPDGEDHPCAFMPDASTSSPSEATSCLFTIWFCPHSSANFGQTNSLLAPFRALHALQ